MVSQAPTITSNNSTDAHFGWSETDVLFRNNRIFKRYKRSCSGKSRSRVNLRSSTVQIQWSCVFLLYRCGHYSVADVLYTTAYRLLRIISEK
ncbi:hypothetical protein Y032_0017g3448 [Ancylostoma ceylanicum]|uniref:Uncharacterized protein n=1 Tax=Ancylostoma ceylanicum TaxID=53326 RepID=A0A016V6I8_9BILA|nr:hypothetical protein Y032_0017g3448 [Ancylostoma ceylanicum]